MEEKRKHLRIFVEGWHIRMMSGPLQVRVGNVIELSLGGLRYICDQKFNSGDNIDFELIFPDGKKHMCFAKIIYRKEPEGIKNKWIYGAEFINLSEEAHRDIKNFMEHKLQSENQEYFN